jgi:hypothetical protein
MKKKTIVSKNFELVNSIFQLLRLMQKLASPNSNLISRSSIFDSTTSSINAKYRYPVVQKTYDEMTTIPNDSTTKLNDHASN